MTLASSTALSLSEVSRDFGGLRAVDAVSLSVRPGRSEERRVGKECRL